MDNSELLTLLKEYQKTKDKKILAKIYLANKGLVYHFADKYHGEGIERADLESIGTIALITAIQKFDWQKYPITLFGHFAYILINNSIISELNNYKHYNKIKLDFLNNPNSLDIPEFVQRDLENTDIMDDVYYDMLKDKLKLYLKKLNITERKLLFLRYKMDMTQKEIVDILGMKSRANVAYHEKRILKKLKTPQLERELHDFLN